MEVNVLFIIQENINTTFYSPFFGKKNTVHRNINEQLNICFEFYLNVIQFKCHRIVSN